MQKLCRLQNGAIHHRARTSTRPLLPQQRMCSLTLFRHICTVLFPEKVLLISAILIFSYAEYTPEIYTSPILKRWLVKVKPLQIRIIPLPSATDSKLFIKSFKHSILLGFFWKSAWNKLINHRLDDGKIWEVTLPIYAWIICGPVSNINMKYVYA